MKFIFLALFFSLSSLAQTESVAKKFEVYAQSNIKQLSGAALSDLTKSIDSLATVKLDEEKDLQFVQNIILVLMKLDEVDPSRTAVMVLSQSYSLNTPAYKKAFKNLKASKNKAQLEEIEAMMKDFSTNGNG